MSARIPEKIENNIDEIKKATQIEPNEIDEAKRKSTLDRLGLSEELDSSSEKVNFNEKSFESGIEIATEKSTETKAEKTKFEKLKEKSNSSMLISILEELKDVWGIGLIAKFILKFIKKDNLDEATKQASEKVEFVTSKFEKFELYNILSEEEKELFQKVIKDPETFTDQEKKDIIQGKMSLKDAYNIIVEKSKNKEKFGDTPLPTIEVLTEERARAFLDKVKYGFKRNIEKKYNITLNKENSDKFNKLFNETIKDNEIKAKLLKYYNVKEITFFESSDLILETITKPAIFTLRLVAEGIIPISDLGIDIVGNATDLVKVSVGELNIETYISTSELSNFIDGKELTTEQATLIYATLYRKGGLVFRTLGAALALSGNTLVENYGIKVEGPDSNLKGYAKKADEIAKIEKSLLKKIGVNQNNGIVSEASEIFKKIEKNYDILAVNSGNMDISDFTSKYGGTHTKESILKQLYNGDLLANNMNGKLNNLLSEVDLREFRREANKIIKFQNSREANFLSKGFKSLEKVGALGNLKRIGDKIAYDATNKESLKALSQMAKESPKLLGHILGKGAIIMVGNEVIDGVQNEDASISDSLMLMASLFPIIGGIYIIGENAITFENGIPKIKDKKMFFLGSSIIALDTGMGIYASKGGLKSVGKFMIQPVTDFGELIYHGGRGAKLTAQATRGGVQAGIKLGAKEGFKEFAKHFKGIPGFSKLLKTKLGRYVLGIPLLIGGSVAYANDILNEDEDITTLKEKGILNKDSSINSKKAKEYFASNEFTKSERDEVISGTIKLYSGTEEGLLYKKTGDTLDIISENENLQNDNFINGEMLVTLSYLGIENVNFYYKEA